MSGTRDILKRLDAASIINANNAGESKENVIKAEDMVSLEEIGKGGHGIIYKFSYNNEWRAVKKFKSSSDSDAWTFANEKRIMNFVGGFSCPYVVTSYKCSIDDAIVMEYLPNNALQQVFCFGRSLRPSHLYQMFGDIARGISFLHQKNIAHLDIKPENILIHDGWKAKLADFGLSCFIGEEINMRGTYGYMAPEFYKDTKSVNQKADIYSFGFTMWSLASGGMEPFYRKDKDFIKTQVINGGREAIHHSFSRELAQLITDCWQDNAELRPTADECVERLDNMLRAEEKLTRIEPKSTSKDEEVAAASRPCCVMM